MSDRPAKFAFLEHDGILAFAHRGGAAGDHPENTMPAFEAAVRMGYRYLETDAHLTRDGVLLAFHDEVLDRVTDRNGLVAALDFAEVKKALVEGREPIPLMEDLLAAWPDVRVNIDPKHDAAVGPLIRAIKRTNSLDRVCIGSFSDKRIRQLRDGLGPRLCTSMGPFSAARLRFGAWGAPVGRFAEGCAQLPIAQWGIPMADGRLIDFAHRNGLQVHVWTIDDAGEMNRLLNLGVDGLMTDRPKVLKEVLEARGLW